MPERPAGVPAEAVWDSGGREWVLVPHPDEQGRKHGLVTYWRADGSLVCRTEYRHGVPHGAYTRYHESGEASRSGAFIDGKLDGLESCYRSTAPTTELAFDDSLPDVIVRQDNEMSMGQPVSSRFYDRDGNEVTRGGQRLPDRPPGLDERAEFAPAEEWWYCGGHDAGRGPGTRAGLWRFWRPDGTLVRVEYHRDGKHVACADRRPGQVSQGSPLIEAARDGDEAAVRACLAAGLGTVAGAARHAAYAGQRVLASRLSGGGGTGPGSHGGGAVPPWPGRPEPARPPNVDPGAVWVPGVGSRGGWLLGELDADTGAAAGAWRLWKPRPEYEGDDESTLAGWERTAFSAGRPVLRRDYYGFRLSRPEDLATRVHEDGFPLYEELHYETHGGVRLRRMFHGVEPGLLDKEIEVRGDGTRARRGYHPEGGIRSERVQRGEALVTERWYAPDGTLTAEVSPAAEPYLDDEGGKPVEVEWWRGLDGGRVIAEGLVRADRGPVGPWRLLDAGGAEYATVSFAPLTESSLGMRRRPDLGQVAVALHAWEQEPWPDALAGVHDVGWAEMDTFFGGARHFPFLLKGLAQPDRLIFDLALGKIADPVLHQGTIAEVAGPVVRYLVALAPGLADEDLCGQLLEFLADVATRDGSLGAVAQIKRIYRSLPPADPDPGSRFADAGVEPGYHEVYERISAATPVWSGLAASPRPLVRRGAQVLLAAAVTEEAAAALAERVTAEPNRVIRADAVLGLALHGDAEPGRGLLASLMADAAVDPLAAFCAALSWVRLRAAPAEPAAGLIISALRGDLDTSGFGDLYLGTGSAATDAATTLALLPPEQAGGHLARLCAALDEVDSVNAVSVASALLDIVFPEGYDQDEPLTGPQRQVIAAIAASNNAWTFNVNLYEVLRGNDLPASRQEMRVLAGEAPAEDQETAHG